MQETANLMDEESTNSSEEDEDAELITEDVEEDFLKVLNLLKNKDPEVYKEDVRYFHNDTESQRTNRCENPKELLKKKKKKKTIDSDSVHSDILKSKKLNKDDKFVLDYILNKKFLGGDDINMEEELRKLREEEKELEEEALFEYKFNNRYEEPPDEEFARKYPHTLGRVAEGMEINGHKATHKDTAKNPKSQTPIRKNKTAKKEMASLSKRKLDDLVEMSTVKMPKNSRTPKSLPNLDLTHKNENISVAVNNNLLKNVKKHNNDPVPSENVGNNEKTKKKELKTKKKDYEKLAKTGNAMGKLGNVKLKKKSRYKIRRKKAPTAVTSNFEDTLSIKQTANKGNAENLENLTQIKNRKPAEELENLNSKKKKRKRTHKKQSDGSDRVGSKLKA